MSARILFVSDMHKRYTDSASIRNQVVVQNKIQQEIITFVHNNNVTDVVILGDWYDRGFHGIGPAYGSMELDRRLSAAVDGRVYLCVGNHFYLERDENPEMYVIQPNDYIKPSINIPLPDKPIFQMVQQLNIGTVQIDFFHFSKINKEYVAYRNPSTTFHIGVYHDDVVVPGWVREQEGFTGASSQSYMNKIYSNIDLAIHGHIHTAIGMTSIQLDNGRKVPLIIPGGLGISQNKEIFKHKEVKLPIVDIDDNSRVQLKLATFSTHLDELEFHAPRKRSKKAKRPLVNTTDNTVRINESSTELQSLHLYLTSKGYEERQLNLINAALSETLDLVTAVRILAEVDETS